MKSIFYFVIFSLSYNLYAQSIELNDFSRDFSKNSIKSRHCFEVSYNGTTPVDTFLVSDSEFDQKGRIVHYTKYFAKKRKLYELFYEYNPSNELTRCYVQHAFYGWEPVELSISLEEGKVMALECPIVIRNFWQRETYHYNDRGRMTYSEEWENKEGEWTSRLKQDYPSTIHSGENTPTYIHNPSGLLILHQLYDAQGTVKAARHFTYTHY